MAKDGMSTRDPLVQDDTASSPFILVMQCRQCKAIVGDSTAWWTSCKPLAVVALFAKHENIAIDKSLTASAAGQDFGCSFRWIRCGTCQVILGKRYDTTRQQFDFLRNMYCYLVDQVMWYQIGSFIDGADSFVSNDEVYSLPSTIQISRNVAQLAARVASMASMMAEIRKRPTGSGVNARASMFQTNSSGRAPTGQSSLVSMATTSFTTATMAPPTFDQRVVNPTYVNGAGNFLSTQTHNSNAMTSLAPLFVSSIAPPVGPMPASPIHFQARYQPSVSPSNFRPSSASSNSSMMQSSLIPSQKSLSSYLPTHTGGNGEYLPPRLPMNSTFLTDRVVDTTSLPSSVNSANARVTRLPPNIPPPIIPPSLAVNTTATFVTYHNSLSVPKVPPPTISVSLSGFTTPPVTTITPHLVPATSSHVLFPSVSFSPMPITTSAPPTLSEPPIPLLNSINGFMSALNGVSSPVVSQLSNDAIVDALSSSDTIDELFNADTSSVATVTATTISDIITVEDDTDDEETNNDSNEKETTPLPVVVTPVVRDPRLVLLNRAEKLGNMAITNIVADQPSHLNSEAIIDDSKESNSSSQLNRKSLASSTVSAMSFWKLPVPKGDSDGSVESSSPKDSKRFRPVIEIVSRKGAKRPKVDYNDTDVSTPISLPAPVIFHSPQLGVIELISKEENDEIKPSGVGNVVVISDASDSDIES